MKIRLFVLTKYTNVTDGRIDRHRMTAWQHAAIKTRNGTKIAAVLMSVNMSIMKQFKY